MESWTNQVEEMELISKETVTNEVMTEGYVEDHGNVSQEKICMIYNISLRLVVGGLVAVFGIFGNTLTIIIMGGDRRKSPTIRCLFYLAIVDSLACTVYGFCSVTIPAIMFQSKLLALRFRVTIIAYVMPVAQTINLISIWITVIVTWQRYISVCRPHKVHQYGSHRIINISVTFVIICSIFFHLPQIFQDKVLYDYPAPGLTTMVEAHFSTRKSYTIFYMVMLHYSITYILPMTGLSIMTYGLKRATVEARTKNLTEGKTSATMRARHELTISLMVVVVVFMICQSVSPLHRILMWINGYFYGEAVNCGDSLSFFAPFLLISIIINSAANFVIYILCANGFRLKLRKLLGFKKQSEESGTSKAKGTSKHILDAAFGNCAVMDIQHTSKAFMK